MAKTHSVASHRVAGGGGVSLYVEETGRADGRPILFIHGFNQCRLVWAKQTNSSLADEFRLITLDNRGHGLSDKPRDAYGESRLWAEDIAAVIDALRLERPVLVGWSYAGLIVLDYLRHYGEDGIAGVNLVGARTCIGTPAAIAATGEKYLPLRQAMFSGDITEAVDGLARFLKLCTYNPLPPEEYYLFLGFNAVVPPYVRQGLMSRATGNDDLLPTLQKPFLITHGTEDAVILPRHAEHNAALLPNAKISFYPEAGHNTFWEHAPRFNRELQAFAASV
ncbi:alpha/beta fold hydrolase [Anaeroselena agilis]|uniref:Alpha/beta hydrolase n=1 Tax=Anaeroselena agilis TaxID=3063788 RepID=A0ABU3NSQ4_9FIRM|nr:alpha/beta hydrolase [Selenomonadales bacterium 4137-cl]